MRQLSCRKRGKDSCFLLPASYLPLPKGGIIVIGIIKITCLETVCLLALTLLILACGEEKSQTVAPVVEELSEPAGVELTEEELAALKEAAEKEIRETWAAHAEAVSNHEKKEIGKYWFDSNKTFMFVFAKWGNPGQNYQVKGTRNIVNLFASWWNDKNWRNLRLITSVSEVVIQGDKAVSTGNYDFSTTLGRGTYVALWRKNPKGKWVIFGIDFPDRGFGKRLDFEKEKKKIMG